MSLKKIFCLKSHGNLIADKYNMKLYTLQRKK